MGRFREIVLGLQSAPHGNDRVVDHAVGLVMGVVAVESDFLPVDLKRFLFLIAFVGTGAHFFLKMPPNRHILPLEPRNRRILSLRN